VLAGIAWSSVGIAFACSLAIIIEEIPHPQKMWIMNIVWPVTSLYFSVFGLWAYFCFGRGCDKEKSARGQRKSGDSAISGATVQKGLAYFPPKAGKREERRSAQFPKGFGGAGSLERTPLSLHFPANREFSREIVRFCSG
jgi:hypothetical protein